MIFLRTNILILIIATCMNIQAQHVINVAVNGCDNVADGTIEKPFGTLEKAYKKAIELNASDTIFINISPGIYYFDKTFEIVETPNVPIVINGSSNGLVINTVFSGGIKLEGWEKTPEGYLKAHVKESEKYGFMFEQLYVNGKRAQRAKSPDKDWFYIQEAKETVHYRGNGPFPEYATLRFSVNPKDLETIKQVEKENITDICATFLHYWDNTRKYISELKPDSGYIFISGQGQKPWNPIQKGSRYILENYKQALTAQGEWFLERNGDLFYIPRNDESGKNIEVYAPSISTLIKFVGKKNKPVKNIILRNIAFEYTGYIMPKNGNEAEQAAVSIPATIHLDYAENIVFDKCMISNTANYGIWFRRDCHNCLLINSRLIDLGAGGIKIGDNKLPFKDEVTDNIIIENNIIQKTGRVFPCGVGIAILNSSYNKVIHNEISNLKYTGVSVGWVWGYTESYANNNEIAYNHIHHIGWGELSDMGAVYTLGNSPGTHIHHNVIHDVYSYDYGGWGLYTDEGSSNIIMENNLVYGCKNGSFHQHYGKDNIIRNNIFAFGMYYQLQLTRAETHRSFKFYNNIILSDSGIFLSGPWDKAIIDIGSNLYWDTRNNHSEFLNMNFYEWEKKYDNKSIIADPLFVDPLIGDFRFKSKRNIRKIGFIPFDYSKVGVYGSFEWKEMAKMSKFEVEEFNNIISKREKNLSGYYLRCP